MRVALVCSAHGFGHLTRQLALAEGLLARGHEPIVVTAAPDAVLDDYLPGVARVPWRVDVGLVQADSLTEDPEATAAAVARVSAEERIDALAAELRGFERVVVDLAPAGLEAARRAGVSALAVGNFDWPWIYRHYPALRGTAAQLARWQAAHPAAQLRPGPDLTGFAQVHEAGLLGRRRPAVRVAERAVLVSFGGLGLADIDARLPRLDGVTWVVAAPMPRLDRPDVRYVEGVSYPALVAGADAVLTKPGYGIHAETVLAGTPVVFLDRGAFPEAPFLEAAMLARGDVKVAGEVGPALDEVWSRPRPAPAPVDDTLDRLVALLQS